MNLEVPYPTILQEGVLMIALKCHFEERASGLKAGTMEATKGRGGGGGGGARVHY